MENNLKKLIDAIFIGLLFFVVTGCLRYAFAQPPVKEVGEQLRFNEFVREVYPDSGVCDMKLHQLSDVPKPTAVDQCIKPNADLVTYSWGACGGSGGVRPGTILSTLNFPSSPGDPGQPLLLNQSQTGMVYGNLNLTQMSDVPDRLPTERACVGFDPSNDDARFSYLPFPDPSQQRPVGVTYMLSYPSAPTGEDLKALPNGSVIEVNTPSHGFFFVGGADSDERHSFAMDVEADANNPQQSAWIVGSTLNYGYSSFGDIFGSLFTEDRGQAFTPSNTPILRVEMELRVTSVPAGANRQYGFDSTLTFLVRKTEIPSPPSRLWIRFYSGVPSNTNEVDTVEMSLQADNPSLNYRTYIDTNDSFGLTEVADLESIKYFRLFTSSPQTNDQTSNSLDLHATKSLVAISTGGNGGGQAETGASIVQKLEALSGNSRLNATAVRNIPSETGPTIVTKLMGLSGNARLDATAVRDIPAAETGPTIVQKLMSLSGNARLDASAIKDLPNPQTGGADLESVITPSIASGDYATATVINLTGTSLDSTQGLTVASNRITFSKAGTYFISAGFRINPTGSTDAGGARSMARVSLRKNGSEDHAFTNQNYMRYAETGHGNLLTTFEIEIGGAIKLEANDYIEFYLQTFEQVAALNFEIMSSESSIKVNTVGVGAGGLSQTQVDARINAKVSRPFRTDADTSGQLFQPTGFWSGTEAQRTALGSRDANTLYFVPESQ